MAGISKGITYCNRLAIVFDAIFTSTLSNEIDLHFLRNQKLKSFSWYKHALVLLMLCVSFRFFRFFSCIFLHYFSHLFFSFLHLHVQYNLLLSYLTTIFYSNDDNDNIEILIKRPFSRVQRRYNTVKI